MCHADQKLAKPALSSSQRDGKMTSFKIPPTHIAMLYLAGKRARMPKHDVRLATLNVLTPARRLLAEQPWGHAAMAACKRRLRSPARFIQPFGPARNTADPKNNSGRVDQAHDRKGMLRCP